MEAKPQPGEEDRWSTRRFFKEMRQAIENKSRGYRWYREYAATHRKKLMEIATGPDHIAADQAVRVMKSIPREPTRTEKLRERIRLRFSLWRSYIVNSLPDKIGPFRIP